MILTLKKITNLMINFINNLVKAYKSISNLQKSIELYN